MKLQEIKNRLLDFADQTGVSQTLIINFIEQGGQEFLSAVFTAYVVDKLIQKDFLDEITPVGALSLGDDIITDIFNDFQEQFVEKNDE